VLQSPSSYRPILALALPVLAEEALNLLVGYTDWLLAGRLLPGDDPKAAMGLIAYLLWLLPSLFAAISIGSLAVVARLVGAGQRAEAAHVARQALLLGVVAAAAATLLMFVGGAVFVAAMQLTDGPARLATRYVQIISLAIPLIMLEQVGSACLRGAGDTVSGLAARGCVNLVNVLVSVTLVAGLGPFPKLGWEGLAIGTLCGHVVGGTILLWRLTYGQGGLSLRHRDPERQRLLTIDPATMRRILRVGLPGGVDVWSVLAGHLTYAAIINRLGPLAQAAHGLGLQIEAMSYLPGSAFGVAAATLAGQSLGAADPRRAVRSVLASAFCAVLIMSGAGLVLFFAGEELATLFVGERNELAILTGRLLKIVAFSCPSLAILIVFLGALRGSGDTAWPLAMTLVGLFGVRLPLACLLAWDHVPLFFLEANLPAAGLGVAGAWMAMVTDVILRSVLAAGRFFQGGWRKVVV
jgi:putative MATE family efflux protein